MFDDIINKLNRSIQTEIKTVEKLNSTNSSVYEKRKRNEKIKAIFANSVWNTEKIKLYDYLLEEGAVDELGIPSPYHRNNINFKARNLFFQYSDFEKEEFKKCSEDILHFANNYVFLMTDDGVKQTPMRDYQNRVLKELQENRFNVWVAPRQIGKTTTSAIFIIWFLIFNKDKNAMILANKSVTMIEIIDKIVKIYENLPMFMKPGLKNYGSTFIKFDNGCRLFGQATTQTPGLGYAIHMLYIDEFAHIHPNIVEPFYRSIYPTLSSSKVSRFIITSTPNGLNKFFEIWSGALEKKNSFNPIRVDWWEVPGRDEKWKQTEIENLGSLKLFNQEYNNQFLTEDQAIVNFDDILFLNRIKKDFVHKKIDIFDETRTDYEFLRWHPKIDPNNLKDKYITISVDFSEGLCQNYTVINIFEMTALPKSKFNKIFKANSEKDFFRFRQIGYFRDNCTSLKDVAKIFKAIITDLIDCDKCKIILEVNDSRYKDILNEISPDMYYIFLTTFHTEAGKYRKIGVKLNRSNRNGYLSELKNRISRRSLIIEDSTTINELKNFGINEKGVYVCDIGNDDLAMTCANQMSFYFENGFYELISLFLDDPNHKEISEMIYNKLKNTSNESGSVFDVLEKIEI